MNISGLVCPVTKMPLTEMVRRSSGERRRRDRLPDPTGASGIAGTGSNHRQNLAAPQYAEAYSEMEFYNAVGARRAEQIRAAGSAVLVDSVCMKHLFEIARLPASERSDFPNPSLLRQHRRRI